MEVNYVDIFYSHRFDPGHPARGDIGALDAAVRQGAVRQGEALYVGISSYSGRRAREATTDPARAGHPLLVSQPSYSLLDPWIEEDLLDVLEAGGVGCIVFCPLVQALLTDKYLGGVPVASRADLSGGYLSPTMLADENMAEIRALNDLAKRRGSRWRRWRWRGRCATPE